MMPDLGKYAFTVLGAWGAALILLAAMTLWVWLRARKVRADLARLEARNRPHMPDLAADARTAPSATSGASRG